MNGMARRADLAAFQSSRRDRLRPEYVGPAPGSAHQPEGFRRCAAGRTHSASGNRIRMIGGATCVHDRA